MSQLRTITYDIETDPKGGYYVLRNGRVIKTPEGRELKVPSLNLAEVIIQEWRAEPLKFKPQTHPITRIAYFFVDYVEASELNLELFRGELMGFIETDILLYRALHPQKLVNYEAMHWDPVLNQVKDQFGIQFVLGSGVVPLKQAQRTLDKVEDYMKCLNLYHFGILYLCCRSVKSFILSLTLVEGFRTGNQIVDLACLEENFQMQEWGQDPLILKKQSDLRQELAHFEKFLTLV